MPFITKNSFYYLEVILIVLIYLLLGLWLHPSDPLMLHTSVPFTLILLITLALYYGLTKGVLAIAIMSIVYIYNYDSKDLNRLLGYLVVTLVAGQFFHYWQQNYQRAKEEANFLKSRVDELSTSFYALKISHDELEKDYALTPRSLRRSMQKLQDIFFQKGSFYENFLNLISKSYHIQNGVIAIKKKKKFKTVCSSEDTKKLKLDDVLVQKAIEHQKMCYINGDIDDKKSRYIAVIPAIRDDKIEAIMAISKMPFMEFNQNNLISISILFSFFLSQTKLWKFLQKEGYDSVAHERLFDYDYETLRSLNKSYKLPTAVLIFKPTDELMQQKLIEILKRTLRKTDNYKLDLNEGARSVVIILPLTALSTAQIVATKILKDAKINPSKISYMGFDISQEKLISQYIKEDSYGFDD